MLILVGLLYTDDLFLGLKKVETQLSLLVIPLVIALINPSRDSISKYKIFFAYAMFAFILVSFSSLGYNYIVNFEHRNDYNFIQRSMYHFHFPYDVLYLNTAYIFLISGKTKSWIKGVSAFLFFTVILLFGVRMGLALFIFINIVYVIIHIRKLLKFKYILRFLVFIGVFVGISALIHQNSRYANDKFYDTLDKIGFRTSEHVTVSGEKYHKINERELIWKNAFNIIKKNPLFGYGTGGDQKALNNEYIKDGRIQLIGLNAHNQYISSSVQYGIVGFTLLIALLFYLLIEGYKTRNIEAMLYSLAIMISFVTEVFLDRQKGVMFFALFYSLYILEIRHQKEQKKIAGRIL